MGSAHSFLLRVHFKYEFSRLATDVTPYFANRTNVSGEAGILGNDQEPVNWGPPNLNFSSGVAGLSEPEYARNANQTQAFSYDSLWNRGRHSIRVPARTSERQQFNIFSQQDARGTLAFTGAATQALSGGVPVAGTGSDLADFMLGIPDTVSISFGNADKYLRGWIYDAFINDDWRINSGFTLNVGLRWEHAEPLTELQDRLANLDIVPGFTAAAPVVASDPTGKSLPAIVIPIHSCARIFAVIEPRLGIAWRPRPNSPLVIRAGYGIYDNTSVYQVVASQLAQQPPFTKTLSLQNSVTHSAHPGHRIPARFHLARSNTFAVDPGFRVGYAQNWNLSVQQDLPGSLTMTATYLGTKGTRLMQEYLPNTFSAWRGESVARAVLRASDVSLLGRQLHPRMPAKSNCAAASTAMVSQRQFSTPTRRPLMTPVPSAERALTTGAASASSTPCPVNSGKARRPAHRTRAPLPLRRTGSISVPSAEPSTFDPVGTW